MEPLDVADLVHQTLERYPVPSSIEVELDLPDRLPPAYADPRHVVQVLGNLVTNACQAMVEIKHRSTTLVKPNPRSTTLVEIKHRSTDQAGPNEGVPAQPHAGKLTLSARKQGDMIAIRVKDTGTGIPAENLSKVFEPLYTTKLKGIGLGLAVSQKLIEANGGSIEVQSEMGKGSIFTIYLPGVRPQERSNVGAESD